MAIVPIVCGDGPALTMELLLPPDEVPPDEEEDDDEPPLPLLLLEPLDDPPVVLGGGWDSKARPGRIEADRHSIAVVASRRHSHERI